MKTDIYSALDDGMVGLIVAYRLTSDTLKAEDLLNQIRERLLEKDNSIKELEIKCSDNSEVISIQLSNNKTHTDHIAELEKKYSDACGDVRIACRDCMELEAKVKKLEEEQSK